VIRYLQSRNELPSAQGLADPVNLNTFLRSFCAFDAAGAQLCDGYLEAPGSADQIVNLWRLGGFVNNALTVRPEPALDTRIRDLLAAGIAPIVALRLNQGERLLGSHFAVATGVAANGAILLQDPLFGRESLAEYEFGFNGIRGELSGVVSLIPRAPTGAGFLIATTGLSNVQTPDGACGANFSLTTVTAEVSSTVVPEPFSLYHCEPGESNLLQAFVAREGATFQGTFTDLGNPGNREEVSGGGSSAFRVTRRGAQWSLAPLDIAFDAANVVNAATLTRDLAPGSLAAIFGTGFLRPGAPNPDVLINGSPARVVQVFPFQLNFLIPPDVAAPGDVTLAVSSDYGYAEQVVTLKRSAPAVLKTVANAADSRTNSRYNPIARGQNIQVFVTGLSRDEVKAYLGGVESRVVSVAAAGASLPGISIVTVAVPQTLSPSLAVELTLTQGEASSNTVEVAVQ
jgi:uncharacterized protein (TIGR03437 family)